MHPYAALTPEVVLDAVAALGMRPDGRLLALSSYENRVYQVWLEDDAAVVAKFYRPGRWTEAQIDEEHAFARELAEREIPVVAPSHKSRFSDFIYAVYPRRGGRTPELGDVKTLEWIGRFLGRIHAVGALKQFVERPALDIGSFGEEPRRWLLDSGMIPPDLLDAWRAVVDLALQGARNCFERAGSFRAIRLHGDCHAGNVLWTPAGPHFVDLDDARSGPAIQDLWMLLPADPQAANRSLRALVSGYEQFRELQRDELALIEALRTLRLLHYCAWIGRRWDDPAFPAAFPWFGTQRYWQDRILEMHEQVAAMQEPPLTC